MTTEEIHFNALYQDDATNKTYLIDNASEWLLPHDHKIGSTNISSIDMVNFREFDNTKRWFINPTKHYVMCDDDFKKRFTLIMRDII